MSIFGVRIVRLASEGVELEPGEAPFQRLEVAFEFPPGSYQKLVDALAGITENGHVPDLIDPSKRSATMPWKVSRGG